jgi:UDP-GlcNAc3NAcA epimerase
MKKIVTIIGARPQIIKSAALSRAVREVFPEQIREMVVHTGQHYDQNMSEVFFEEMGIPKPSFNLGVGSGSHGKQTAEMLSAIEQILVSEKPDALVVYGDTNSTLAGATAAAKLHVPIVHIEAGLRSYNKKMPEEVNRVVCDHLSTLLFSPTKSGFDNLIKEGFSGSTTPPFNADNPKIYHCGDVMFDNSHYFSTLADEKSTVIVDNELTKGNFILSTIHRNNNTDDPERLGAIFSAFLTVLETYPEKEIVLPLHPRTKNCMFDLPEELQADIKKQERLKIIDPVSFFNIIALEKYCDMVVTDSGGLQKEAFFFQKPCVILRPETEWVEIVENGNALIADADYDKILAGIKELYSRKNTLTYPPLYGDGKSAEFICREIIEHL